MDNLTFVGIIPARYASSRFPGKPLADIGGMTMIERVYRQASKVLPEVVVATDDDRILKAVTDFGGKAVMTSDKHRSGTDRICEAYSKLALKSDVIINIQGDEPFIAPGQIEALMKCFQDPKTDIATLARVFDKQLGFEALFDPNLVKLVRGDDGTALYFSRSIVPYVRGRKWEEWLDNAQFLTHVGMYAYRAKVLREITRLPQSTLEVAESLEQLRWLQNGYRIKVELTDIPTIGIDTPDDLERAREYAQQL